MDEVEVEEGVGLEEVRGLESCRRALECGEGREGEGRTG